MSGEACCHYHFYEHDFDLACSWGHNAHRFSIEWSRIEPAAGQWNTDAVAHYHAVLRAMQQRGLEPVVTLYHFTTPAWFDAVVVGCVATARSFLRVMPNISPGILGQT